MRFEYNFIQNIGLNMQNIVVIKCKMDENKFLNNNIDKRKTLLNLKLVYCYYFS